MTKAIVSVLITLTTMQAFAQVSKRQTDNVSTQAINPVPYRLFPTQNIWNFIKLDTRNGQMWQVQFGLKDEDRLVVNLSSVTLVAKEEEVNDRFTLYPTTNTYNFILLDQISGKTWQVQWSTEPRNRMVLPIE